MKENNQTESSQNLTAQDIKNNVSGRINLVIISILVGTILVSASIFYNAKLILNKFEGRSGVKGVVTGQQDIGRAQGVEGSQKQQAAVQQAAPQNNEQVTVAERKDAPILGNKNAKVVVYEFSDFQCPFCVRFFKESHSQLKAKYIDTGKIKLVFRHLPLPFHQNAQKAAEAAECASRQGKFGEYHNLLFQNSQPDGTGLNIDDLKKYANQLGLNNGTLGFGENKFNTCLDKGETAEMVKKDSSDAAAIGIGGTPTFVINGVKIIGAQPFANFEQVIEDALKK